MFQLKKVSSLLACASMLGMSAVGASAADDTITIGAVIAESGFMSQYDLPALEAAKMAIEDLNAGKLAILGDTKPGLLGKKVKLVVRDYRTDRSVAPTVAAEVLEEGAQLLLASCDFDFGSPAALIAQEENIVSMSLCAGSPRFGPEGGLDLGFSAGSVAEAVAASGAEWAFEEKGWMTVYLLNDPVIQVDTDWTQGFKDRFIELAGSESIVGEDSFKNGDANISAQISRIRALPTPPDVIAVSSFPPGGAAAVRQIRAAGITQPIMLNHAMDGDAWWESVPVSGRKNIFLSIMGNFQGEDDNERINALTKRYKERTGSMPPGSLLFDGYAAIELLALGVSKANSVDGPSVTKAMEGFNKVDRLAGPASFSPDLHVAADRGVAIHELTADGAVFITRRAAKRVPKYAN